MLESELKVKLRQHESRLMLKIATVRYRIEEIIFSDYNKMELEYLQKEMILCELYLKWIRLGDYRKLPYPI